MNSNLKFIFLIGILVVFSNCSSKGDRDQSQSKPGSSGGDRVEFIPWKEGALSASTTPTLSPQSNPTPSAQQTPPAQDDFSSFWNGKPYHQNLSLHNMMRDHKRTDVFGPEVALEDQPIEYRAARAELIRRGVLKDDQKESVSGKRPGVTVLLDTSQSMQDHRALPAMKDAAKLFVENLKRFNKNVEFKYYRFATRVEKMDKLSELDVNRATGQFTSLYSAIAVAMRDHPDNSIILFTDGADNKSPDSRDLPVENLSDLMEQVEQKKTRIHAVKLGIEDSNDSKGVDNIEALKALTKYGDLYDIQDIDELIEGFDENASWVRCASRGSSLNSLVEELEIARKALDP